MAKTAILERIQTNSCEGNASKFTQIQPFAEMQKGTPSQHIYGDLSRSTVQHLEEGVYRVADMQGNDSFIVVVRREGENLIAYYAS